MDAHGGEGEGEGEGAVAGVCGCVCFDDKRLLPQVYNVSGAYAVRFYRGGKWRVVIVDDFIPCDK